MMTRRSFIWSVLAAGAAPAYVRASSLMPLWVPRTDLVLPGEFWEWSDAMARPVIRYDAEPVTAWHSNALAGTIHRSSPTPIKLAPGRYRTRPQAPNTEVSTH